MFANAIFIALFANPAMAWEHTGVVWDRDDMPLEWEIGVPAEDSIGGDVQVQMLIDAWDNWVDGAPCARLSHEYMGIDETYSAGFSQDSQNHFNFDDPEDEIGTGTLAATLCLPNDFAFTLMGQSYYYAYDCDIVYNTDLDWGASDDIDAGNCNSEYSLEAVSTHEIGHLWGMGHSCEEGETCTDPDLRYATMYWSTGPCTNYQSAVGDDDVEGINALYGPYCSFSATEDSERDGGAPLEVCFEVECNEDVEQVDWNFGDGTTSTELNPCHEYTEKGQYTVSMTITGEGEDCGTWEYTQYELSYVLVCGIPEPGLDGDGNTYEGMFTYEHSDGLIYQMINQSDTSVYGCIDQVQWDVYSGDTLDHSVSAWSPKIEFPATGDYRVVLNVGGPGGVAAAELTVTVEDIPAEEDGLLCGTVAPAAGLFGLLAGLGAAVRRREQ
jgi:PKD repeat protein